MEIHVFFTIPKWQSRPRPWKTCLRAAKKIQIQGLPGWPVVSHDQLPPQNLRAFRGWHTRNRRKWMNMRPFRELPDYHSPTHRSKVAFLANWYCKSSYPFAHQIGPSNGQITLTHVTVDPQSHPKVRLTPKSIQTCQSNIHHGDLFLGQSGQEFIELYGLAARRIMSANTPRSVCYVLGMQGRKGKHGKTS